MKKLLLLLILLLNCGRVLALEVVYPKTNPVKINANSTFFIGSTNPKDKLTINGAEVNVSKNGGFAHVVNLNAGKNVFKIESRPIDLIEDKMNSLPSSFNGKSSTNGKGQIDFIIEKPLPTTFGKYTPPTLVEYPIMTDFFTRADNVPLRETPIDSGINRMAHLVKGIPLLINGEKGGFYRVYLNSKTYAWINKSDIEQKPEVKTDNSPIKILEISCDENKNFYFHQFKLEKKTTFSIKEENGLTLKLFNVEAEEKILCNKCLTAQQLNLEDGTLTFYLPVQKIMGYDGYFEGEDFILKIRKPIKQNPEKSLKNITIVVDAGHGGSEYGAIGCCGDKEKDINLAIAKNLEQELTQRDAKVVMTRDTDVNMSLADRVKTARENDAVLLISIHANALPDGGNPLKTRGTSVYYYHNQAKALAECILSSMTTQLNTQNDKVKQGSLALVRPTANVSVLIEVAYIINPDDNAMLLDKDFQKNCAKAIADGIENYILKK